MVISITEKKLREILSGKLEEADPIRDFEIDELVDDIIEAVKDEQSDGEDGDDE